jgi:hypothetical protein
MGPVTGEQAHSVLLQEHEILFLDFLGFAAAVQHWDDQRMGKLITLLTAIADAQSDYDIKGEAQSDGSYKITSTAEITTFSDHIVMSYPRIAKPTEVAGVCGRSLQTAGTGWSASGCRQ